MRETPCWTRPERHPVSRYYVCPLADRIAGWLANTAIRPSHVTIAGAGLGVCACGLLLGGAGESISLRLLATAAIWLAWLCDRVDGALARATGNVSRWGAWLDANLDELLELAIYASLALVVAAQGSPAIWIWAYAFIAGKYLFAHGVDQEKWQPSFEPAKSAAPVSGEPVGFARWLYHLPGNADVRLHVLLVSVMAGWFWLPIVSAAIYFQLRWLVRYPLVVRRLRGVGQ